MPLFLVYHGRNRLTHTRRTASLEAAFVVLKRLARHKDSPFPVSILDINGDTVAQFADRSEFRAAIRL
jgi:hypothetical protein